MIKVIGILLVAVIILRIEVPSLLQNKNKKELVVFIVFLSIGVGLGIIQVLGKMNQSPLDLLTSIFKPLNALLFQ